MKIRPILFNTEMVQAILDNRKVCTRRIVKFLPGKNPNWTGYIKDGDMLYNGTNELCIRQAPYQPGDILYVRETWFKDKYRYMYRANYSDSEKFYCNGKEVKIKWHPSIHMPKEAARIWLKVTDVRVERLQEMWASDVSKEGIRFNKPTAADEMLKAFAKLWDSTIKKTVLDRYGWNANPYVWVIEFERCEKPRKE